MKKITLIITLLLLIQTAQAGWFGSDEKIQQQLQATQAQLEQQRSRTGTVEVVAGIFAIGCIVLFIIGTAIGSKARREAKSESTAQ